jgi:hypothetical protein
MKNNEQKTNGCLKTKIAILEERIAAGKEALILQAQEYQRRLDILNGEAERLKNMQETYLPRETYEANHKYLEEKMNTLQKYIWIGVGGAMVLEIVLRFVK